MKALIILAIIVQLILIGLGINDIIFHNSHFGIIDVVLNLPFLFLNIYNLSTFHKSGSKTPTKPNNNA